MSQTLFIDWRGNGFWAYDVAVGILLKHVIDQACSEPVATERGWLAASVETWRVNAAVSDYGLHLDPSWSLEQRRTVVALIDRACRELRHRPSVSAVEAEAWSVLDDGGVSLRGAAAFPTAPVVELGRAVEALLEGELDPPPTGTWWLFGAEGGRCTIARRAIDGT